MGGYGGTGGRAPHTPKYLGSIRISFRTETETDPVTQIEIYTPHMHSQNKKVIFCTKASETVTFTKLRFKFL